jgi:uncharacterized protein
MDPLALIDRLYADLPDAREILVRHGRQVGRKALRAAERLPHLNPDADFIWEASLLHDIGMRFTRAPGLGCFGDHPYVCHGYMGRELLEKEGFPRHALVCERHVGTGLTAPEIQRQGLPLPRRDMTPVSLEERLICYADKFFSKAEDATAKPLDVAAAEVARYGPVQSARFQAMADAFGP